MFKVPISPRLYTPHYITVPWTLLNWSIRRLTIQTVSDTQKPESSSTLHRSIRSPSPLKTPSFPITSLVSPSHNFFPLPHSNYSSLPSPPLVPSKMSNLNIGNKRMVEWIIFFSFLALFRLTYGLTKIVWWGLGTPLFFLIVIQIYNIWYTFGKPLQRNWVFATNYAFTIAISFQPDCVNL